VHNVLGLTYKASQYDEVLTKEDLVQNLAKIGVTDYSQEDFVILLKKLCCGSGQMTGINRYAGGHLFSLYDKRT
jgi:hypothetical protein